MRAGRLRESIGIWSYTTSEDSYGQVTKSYTLTNTVRAEAKLISELEAEKGGKYEGKTVIEFYIRFTTVDKTDRIVWNGNNYEIIEVSDKYNKRQDLTIMAVTDE